MRIKNLLLCIPILLLASCSQNPKFSSSLILNETVFYPTDVPPSIKVMTDDGMKLISTADYLPSPPIISEDKTKMVYIAPFDFETLGEVWLYEIGEDESKKVFTQSQFEEDQSVKQVHWLNNSDVIVLTGNRYGTVSLYQDLYLVNTVSMEAKLVLQLEENRDIRDLSISDSGVEIKIATYNNNLTEEIIETITVDLTNEADSVKIDSVQNNSISDELQELGLPLKGENVFNPTKIKVGDIVQDFVLTEIQFWEGRLDYPFDTVSAKFKGEAVLTGELEFIKKDEFHHSDWLTFRPDAVSQEMLPISHHESRVRSITFSNQDDAVTATDIKPGQTKNVTLKIQDFTLNFLPTDAENIALFLDIYPE